MKMNERKETGKEHGGCGVKSDMRIVCEDVAGDRVEIRDNRVEITDLKMSKCDGEGAMVMPFCVCFVLEST